MKIHVLASGSSGNCYVLDNGQDVLLLECGIPYDVILAKMGFDVARIAGCLVSHAHKDHSKSIKTLTKYGISIYASKETIKAANIPHGHPRQVSPESLFHVKSYLVRAFETQHDCEGSLGFLVASGENKLMYATDTAYIKPQFRGLTHIMCEVNYCQDILDRNVADGQIDQALRFRVMLSHMSLDTFLNFLKATDLSQLQEIYLMHLSNANSDEAKTKREVQELTGKVVIVC